jgi:hypothetical protein
MFMIWVLIAGDSEQGEATNPSPWPAIGVVAAVTAVLGLAFAVVNRRLKRHRAATRLDAGAGRGTVDSPRVIAGHGLAAGAGPKSR